MRAGTQSARALSRATSTAPAPRREPTPAPLPDAPQADLHPDAHPDGGIGCMDDALLADMRGCEPRRRPPLPTHPASALGLRWPPPICPGAPGAREPPAPPAPLLVSKPRGRRHRTRPQVDHGVAAGGGAQDFVGQPRLDERQLPGGWLLSCGALGMRGSLTRHPSVPARRQTRLSTPYTPMQEQQQQDRIDFFVAPGGECPAAERRVRVTPWATCAAPPSPPPERVPPPYLACNLRPRRRRRRRWSCLRIGPSSRS